MGFSFPPHLSFNPSLSSNTQQRHRWIWHLARRFLLWSLISLFSLLTSLRVVVVVYRELPSGPNTFLSNSSCKLVGPYHTTRSTSSTTNHWRKASQKDGSPLSIFYSRQCPFHSPLSLSLSRSPFELTCVCWRADDSGGPLTFADF